MSEPEYSPQPDPSAAEGSDVSDASPVQGTLPGSEMPEQGSTDGEPRETGTVETRAKGDPNWEKQAKDFQRKFTQLQNKVGTRLQSAFEQIGGGEGAMNHLEAYNRVLSDPQMGPIVQEYLASGRAPRTNQNSDAETEDEYLEKPWLPELETLRGEMRGLLSRLGGVEGTQGMSKLGDFTTRFMDEQGMQGEEREHFKEDLDSKVQALLSQPNGRQILLGLDKASYRTLAKPLLSDELEETLAYRRSQRKQGRRAQGATDAPGSAATGGQEQGRPPDTQGMSFAQLQEMARREIRNS